MLTLLPLHWGPMLLNHILGGSDVIDGDVLDITFTPSIYSPSTTPPEASNVDHLTAHLGGIDEALDPLTNAVVGDSGHLEQWIFYQNRCMLRK